MTKLFSILLLTVLTLNQTTEFGIIYFPEKQLESDPSSDKRLTKWYSGELNKFEEPSLWQLSLNDKNAHEYRLMQLKALYIYDGNVIKVTINKDGTSLVTLKNMIYKKGTTRKLTVRTKEFAMSIKRTDEFLRQVTKSEFWTLPSARSNGKRGDDGEDWLIEGIENGNYHLAVRWCPEKGKFKDLGVKMIKDLGGFTIGR